MVRDTIRYERLNQKKKFDEDRIETRKTVYKAAFKNVGGAAFNIITMDYD